MITRIVTACAVTCVAADIGWHIFREVRAHQEINNKRCYVDRVYDLVRARRRARLADAGGGGGGTYSNGTITIAPGTITYTTSPVNIKIVPPPGGTA